MATRLLAAAALMVAALAAQPTSVQAQPDQPRFDLSVQPRVGGINDIFTVTVRIETRSLAAPESYTAPQFNGFSVTTTTPGGNGRIVDRGAYRRYVELRRYTLQPKRTGQLRIGPARMRYNGRQFSTSGARVDVRDAAGLTKVKTVDPTATGGIGAPGYTTPLPPEQDDMFLHAAVDKKSAYIGEQVTVTWLLFTKGQLGHLSARPIRLVDWWGETLYEPQRNYVFHDVQLGGTDYKVAIVSKRAFFASRSGTLRIPSFQANASLAYRSIMRRLLVGPSIEVKIKPLPGNAPAGFHPSYVGVFTVEAAIDGKSAAPGKPIEIGAGQPIVLKLTVKGQGAVPRTTPPVIRGAGFDFGKPRDKSARTKINGNVVEGERIYRYWTTPRKSGAQNVGVIGVPYFNPATGRYHVAESKPIALLIKAGSRGGVDLTSRSDRLAKELRAIRTGSVVDSRGASRFHDGSWFWLLALLPPLGFVGVVVYQRVRRVMSADTPQSRRRRARGKARKRFRTAAAHLKAGNDRELFAELARLIYETLEHSLQQPVRSKTRPELRAYLIERGFSEELVARIDAEIERCDFARFAPSGADGAELSTALERTEELVSAIGTAASAAAEDEDAA